MFGLFKSDPLKVLQKKYALKLEEGIKAQRNGDIRGYAMITEEAEALYKQIQQLEAERKTWLENKKKPLSRDRGLDETSLISESHDELLHV